VLSFFGYSIAGLPPAAAAAVAAVGTAALVALYLLRERERRVAVAFVPLWDPGGGRRRVERMGRRLRRWLSLLVQLVLLWLLVFALADPRPAAGARNGRSRSFLVLLDRSASMTAAQGSRMAAARREAHRIIAGLEPGDQAMVASFAADVVAASGFGSESGPLDAAVDGVAASEQAADLGRALAFGAAVLRGRPHPTLVLVGDGGYGEPAAPEGIDVRFVPVGEAAGNVALLSFSARRRPLDSAAVDAAVVVQNFSRAPAQAALELRAGRDHRPLERVTVTLGPGERRGPRICWPSTTGPTPWCPSGPGARCWWSARRTSTSTGRCSASATGWPCKGCPRPRRRRCGGSGRPSMR
jgi:Ca-activated chloride channel family protein